MPTYDYLCKVCGHRFEEFHSISAEPVQACPECNGKVERLINGGIGLIFKGSGFYLTDYVKSNSANANNKNQAKSDSTGKSDSEKPADAKSKKSTESSSPS